MAPDPDRDARIMALLAQSRAAHDRKKKAAGLTDKTGAITSRPDYPTAEAAILTALDLRQQAHALDPEHLAPAWSTDQLANRGLTHEQMCAWFAQYLTIP